MSFYQTFQNCSSLRFLLVFILFAAPIHKASAEIELSFGLYTTHKPTAMVKAYRPILNRLESDLEKKTGEPVKIALKISATYEKGIEALVNGEVDFAKLGPASYVFAHQANPDIRIIALDSKGDSKTFNGVICVHKDSNINSIEELIGKTFAFGDERSTIGRFLSQAYLHKHGITVTDLSAHAYLGRHDRVGYAVSQKSYDAGALKEGTFKKLVEAGEELKILATFKNVNKPWVASSTMNDEIYDKLKATMLELNEPSVFKPFSRKQFVSGHDSDFGQTRDSILNNSHFFADAPQHQQQANVSDQ